MPRGKKKITPDELERLKKLMRENIVGTAEAAAILDVERSRIGRWKKSNVMPEPMIELAATPVWWKGDIEDMLGEREKRRRRRSDDHEPIAA